MFDPHELPEVSAGTPIVAEEKPAPRLHDYESIVSEFEAHPDYFLRVQGDSLDRAGFRTGDVVAVKRNPDVRDGDLVVARIGQEITLKRFRRINSGCVELQPESTNAELPDDLDRRPDRGRRNRGRRRRCHHRDAARGGMSGDQAGAIIGAGSLGK